jgi:hypothetical protein
MRPRPVGFSAVGLRWRGAARAGVAEEAQQPRQLTQGVQCHLHGGNEDGMGPAGIWLPLLVVYD